MAALRVLELLFGVWSAPRILELLPGFWSCSQGFGVNVKIDPTFYEKSFKKSTLKPKIEKGLCYHFFTVFFQILQEKNLKFKSKLGKLLKIISQTEDICFSLYIKDYW